MQRLAILVLLLALAACARSRRPGDSPAFEPLTLCIQNETVGYGNVVAHAGTTRFDVLPGKEVCKPIADLGPSTLLQATTTGGGAAGPLSYAINLQPGVDRCWRWRLDNTRASATNLLPCENS